MVLWVFTGTNGNEGDGGGGGGESHTHTHTHTQRLSGWTIIICELKWGTVNLWGEAVTSVLDV